MTRLLTVIASACIVTARHGDRLWGTYRRPPTSCAHRLRKPDRTCKPLTLCCHATPPRGAGSNPRLEARTAMRRHEDAVRRATPRQARRARRWFRATDTERTRAPSIGSTRISRSRQACRVCCSLTRRRLAPCRLPRAWATSSKDGWSLRAIPSPRVSPWVAPQLTARREKDASHRLLQPTYDPSTLWTARFPGALHAVPLDPALAGLIARPDDSRRPIVGHWPPVCPQVKLRLTANLQLQPCRNPSVSRPLGLPRSCADMLP